MKDILRLIAIGVVLAASTAARADSYTFDFVAANGSLNAVITLVTDNTPGPTPGSFDIVGGTISITSHTLAPPAFLSGDGTLVTTPGDGDKFLTPGATGFTPFVDGFGLDFALADAPANHNAVQVYSDYYATGFTGAGTKDYGLSENTFPGFDGQGELILTPEPSSILLLGAGFAFLVAGLLLRRAKPTVTVRDSAPDSEA
jgi:hypothetical protein